jgi:hypothetical protein
LHFNPLYNRFFWTTGGRGRKETNGFLYFAACQQDAEKRANILEKKRGQNSVFSASKW